LRASVEGDVAVLALEDPEWQRFACEKQDSTPFHHPAWAQLLTETYRYRGFAVAVREGDQRIRAGSPFLEVRTAVGRRRWISLPFTDECSPLAEDGSSLHRLAQAVAIVQASHRGPAIELRGTMDELGWRRAADAVTHELELTGGVDNVRRGFSRSQVVRNIARAEREHVVVRRASCREDLDAFYALHTRTRRRQGVPVQPRRFFERLWTRLIEPGLGSILLADTGERSAVAGALFLSFGGTTIYKFGASDPESWAQRPNHLIFWSAIQEACARGDRRFDFGRTDLANAGLRAFKAGWGARERPLVYSTLMPGAATGVVGVSSRILSVAIRRGPSWMCRGLGEALYRFAASR
jgi:CelD/BcsL family acetyltransferase involved in cellulose biosynthesis